MVRRKYSNTMKAFLLLTALVITVAAAPTIDEVKNKEAKDSSVSTETQLMESGMLFAEQPSAELQAEINSLTKRKARRDLRYRWTNGVIPYSMQRKAFKRKERKLIRKAMKIWSTVSCLSFRPRRNRKEPSIKFVRDAGCSSWVGMLNRPGQSVSLDHGCVYKGIILHELGHALGFSHEQSRPDRDEYVTIILQNVKDGMGHNFDKYTTDEINTYGIPYDYRSIMHYGRHDFSKNGLPTIETKDPSKADVLGNRKFLTFNDIRLANVMYSCSASCPIQKNCGSGFLGKDCECWCKGSNLKQPVVYCNTQKPIAHVPNSLFPPYLPKTTDGSKKQNDKPVILNETVADDGNKQNDKPVILNETVVDDGNKQNDKPVILNETVVDDGTQ